MKLPRAALAVFLVVLVALAGATYYTLSVGHPGGPTTVGSPVPTACAVAAGTPDDWLTYHGDAARSGYYPVAATGTAAGPWNAARTLDGEIYAEPLACPGTLYVATEANSVYAISTTNGSVLWQTTFGPPVPGSALPCGDIDPSGITGTPVIDAATSTLFVVAFLAPAHHVLFALDLSSGHARFQETIDPPGSSPTVEQQRGALALANGQVYVPYGGLDGDCGAYHGYVLATPVNGSGTVTSYQVPTPREGGIWSPMGISVAADGNLFVSTGNGASTTTFDYGDSVLELSPTLSLLDFFAPTDWAQLNQADTDLGSVAPTLLPGGLVFQIGKAGVGDLLDAAHLGGIGGQVAEGPVCGGAYSATAHAGTTVYVACTDGVFAVDVTATNFSVAWQTSSFDASAPVVTGGVVWSVDTGAASLRGFNATTGAPVASFSLGTVDHFVTPTPNGADLFVGAGATVQAFSL